MRKPRTERRQQPRVRGVAGLTVGAEPHVKGVSVRDISLAGLSFRANQPISYMTRLMMTLIFPADADSAGHSKKDATRIRCEGAVVRCDPVSGSEGREHEIAVFFTHMDDASREAVEEYIKAHS